MNSPHMLSSLLSANKIGTSSLLERNKTICCVIFVELCAAGPPQCPVQGLYYVTRSVTSLTEWRGVGTGKTPGLCLLAPPPPPPTCF